MFGTIENFFFFQPSGAPGFAGLAFLVNETLNGNAVAPPLTAFGQTRADLTKLPCQPVADGENAVYTAQILDQSLSADAALLASIASIKLSLVATGASPRTVINGVDEIEILNQDRGTLDSAGNLTITLSPADNASVNPVAGQENRSLIIEIEYGTPQKILRHEAFYTVLTLSG